MTACLQPQLDDLCCIILRFRLHGHLATLCTDIEKAFLHIQLHKDDKHWTRFLWLAMYNPQDQNSRFVAYRFRFVLFGAMCLPFMLNTALQCHLAQYNTPIAQNMLANLYVGNMHNVWMSIRIASYSLLQQCLLDNEWCSLQP